MAIAVLSILVVAVPKSFGTTYTSAKTGNWSDTSAWNPAAPTGGPGAGDTAVIDSSHIVTLTASASVGSVVINPGGTLACAGNNFVAMGDLTVNGILDATGASGQTISIGGVLSVGNGGNITYSTGSSAVTVAFTGSSCVWTSSAPSYPFPVNGSGNSKYNWVVNSNASLTLCNRVTNNSSRSFTVYGTLHCGTQVISGAGKFTLCSGGTLDVGDPGGLGSGSGSTSGNIQTSICSSMPADANYIFSGGGNQITGKAMPVSVTGNVVVQNNGLLTVSSTSGLTINAPGTISVNYPATLALSFVDSTHYQSVSGTGNLNGTGTIQVNKSGSTSSDDGIQYSLTNKDLTNLTVEFNGTAQQRTTTASFGNLKLNNPSGLILRNAAVINTKLTLTSGVLATNPPSTLSFGDGATIVRDTGSLAAIPRFGASVNLSYVGSDAVIAGAEIPTNPNILRDLAINKTNGVAINVNTTVNGVLSGTSLINGTGVVTVSPAGTLSPGPGIATLSFANAPILSGTTLLKMDRDILPGADKIVLLSGTFHYSGTLLVTNMGTTFQDGDSFGLFSADSFDGWFDSVTLPVLNAGLSWDTNKLAVSGVLDVYSFAFTNSPVSLSTYSNVPVQLLIAKLLLGASSARGVPQFAYATGAAHGTLNRSDAAITYIPTTDYLGSDCFYCVLVDGNGELVVPVRVQVSDLKNPPTIGTECRLNIQALDGGREVRVIAIGNAGTTYRLQSSSNLATWNDLTATFVMPAAGLTNLDDTCVSGSRYYRLVCP